VTTWIGLALALVSALAVNWAYAKEHDAAVTMPHFSPHRPVRFVTTLSAAGSGERRSRQRRPAG
jgi:hypothetical protein